MRSLERRDAVAVPESPILFYGSSSIRLWESLEHDFPDLPVVNSGFGGSTLAACVYYFDRLVVPLRPRSLVVYAGDNDLGDGQMPDAVLASLQTLQEKVKAQLGETPLAFLSVKPSPARAAIQGRIGAVNEGARRLLAGRPQSFFVDVFTPMLDNGGRPRPALYADDGLHLTEDGYALWTQMVHCYLPRLVG